MFSPSTSTVAAKRRESTTRTRAGGIVCVPSPGAMDPIRGRGWASAAPLAWCGTHAAASRSAIAWTIRKSNVRDSWPRREPADPPARSAGGCAARPRAAVGTTRSPVPRTSRSIQAGVTRWRFPLPRAWRGRAGTAWRTRPSRLIGKFPVGVGICLDALGDLPRGQPLRKRRRQHGQHIQLMFAPFVGKAASPVRSLCH